jgi:hypothetical protein
MMADDLDVEVVLQARASVGEGAVWDEPTDSLVWVAEQAYRAWFCRGTVPLCVLLTTTERISRHVEGLVGPIWRTPAEASGDLVQRRYWLPGEANQGRPQGGQALPRSASFAWTRLNLRT